MKKRKRTGCAVYGLVLWLGISLIFGNVGLRVYGAEEQSNSLAIESPGAFLMEASTGTVIYEKDADTRRSPASVTKIMTALLIFENLEKGKIQLTDEVVGRIPFFSSASRASLNRFCSSFSLSRAPKCRFRSSRS